jgi:long-subunit acyl-CoA synthetase (AMP-forming)
MGMAQRLSRIAGTWSEGAGASAAAVDEAREALFAVEPGDLAAVGPLVEALLVGLGSEGDRAGSKRALAALFDAVRRRSFTTAMRPEDVAPWTRLVLQAVERADYTLGDVLLSREETDPKTVAMRVIGHEPAELTVADLARRTRAIARGLSGVVPEGAAPRVAILADNALDTALTDLACLTNGIVDMPLASNATPDHVAYMLQHSRANVLVVDGEKQLDKVLPALSSLPSLAEVVVVSKEVAEQHRLPSLEQVVEQADAFDDEARAARAARTKSRDLATVMYTSGTTGRPKGIAFDPLNIVSKRFCRAFALPELNEGDVFLAYLPLYHTFGRYLEMVGSLFWGATYVFARSTVQSLLVEDFQSVRPTVFISVPKKWMELIEAASRAVATDDPDVVAAGLRAMTGGRLARGLSAAGYLDPAVFRAFHRAGVGLCSGYGMTEATGGITMTPPGEYVDGSIGKPLPGIECLRADDGELCIRGPYVSRGYFEPDSDEEREAYDAEGWFHTGDLVSIDDEGHYRITGRKKEIYKNRAGRTIAPQRVENIFREFDDVAQAFLVGDHREYNTLLVWPAYDAHPSLRDRSPEELRQLVSSYVASANRFLAPFERVVAFRILDRPLDEAHGELTHKLTFKREVVEKNWKALIDAMYAEGNVTVQVDALALRLPTWVLRELGLLIQDVSLAGGYLRAGGRALEVEADPRAPGSLRIGDLAYRSPTGLFDLGAVLSFPALWLGNDGLRRFLGDEAFRSLAARTPKGAAEIEIDPRVWDMPEPDRVPSLRSEVGRDEATLETLHAAGALLRAERQEARRALGHLERVLASGRKELAPLARGLLRRAAESPEEEIRRRAFRELLPSEEPARTVETVRRFVVDLGPSALRDEDLAAIGERGLEAAQIEALLAALEAPEAIEAQQDSPDARLYATAMRLVTAHALAHPEWCGRVRVPLARLTFHPGHLVAARASEEYDRLRRGFQHWIGPNQRLAVDPATGKEYGWRDVLGFDDGIPPRTAELVLRAISESTLVRASVFLLGKGALISLADIAPGGATVRRLGSRLGKTVYHLSITTRSRETFDVAINYAEAMPPAELRDEVMWLLSSGAPPPLVEQFGSYQPEWGLYTEEFIPGENVDRQIERLSRRGGGTRHVTQWPFLVWTTLAAHVGFWDRTGQRVALREPSPAAFIVPSHDYQTGARLVSISDRGECERLDDVLDRFESAFVAPLEAAHPELAGLVDFDLRASAILDALGLERGRAALATLAPGPRADAARAFLARLDAQGYTPRAVWFASARYRRWIAKYPEATIEAQGTMLGELWTTYRLDEAERAFSDTRIRFFRQTVFAEAREGLADALDRLMARARTQPNLGDLPTQIAGLRSAVKPDAREDWFLARMTFRHLRPSDDTSLISLERGDHHTTEVVLGMTDATGERYFVREVRSPREAARLLQVFRESSMDVAFGPEHRMLVAVDTRDQVIGGVFYRSVSAERTHMEKIVVGRRYRGRGVANGILREFGKRQGARGVTVIETGWFQPEALYRLGFRPEPSSGALVLAIGGAELPA